MDREDKQYIQDHEKKDYTKMKISLSIFEREINYKNRENPKAF